MALNLETLNKVSLLEVKPTIKLTDLKQNVPVPISAKLVSTKFGDTVLPDLEDATAFFPKRIGNVLKDQLGKFFLGTYSIIFRGQKDVQKPELGTAFEFISSETVLNSVENS